MKKVSLNLTNLFASIALVVVGMKVENYRVWNPGKLTGWAFAGYGVFLILAAALGVFVVLAIKSNASPRAPWYVAIAGVIGIAEGVLVTLFLSEFDIGWNALWRGLVTGLVLGVLIALISFTYWLHPKRVAATAKLAATPRVGWRP